MEVGTKVQVQPRAFTENIKVPRTGRIIEYPYELNERYVAVDLKFATSYGNVRVFGKLFVNNLD